MILEVSEPASHSSSVLDERVLSAGTTLRFALLLVLFLAGSAGMTNDLVVTLSSRTDNILGCALAAGVNPEVGFAQGVVPTLGNQAAVHACWARHVPNVSWVPIAATLALIAVAAGLYRLLPVWKGRRCRVVELAEVDVDGCLRQELDGLVKQAGVDRTVDVEFVVDVGAATAGAVVFGTRRHPRVCLHGGLIVKRFADHERFRAVVLHELAHIRNGDVAITYATVAMWRVFLGAVLLPEAGVAVFGLVIGRTPSSWGIPILHESRLVLEALIVLMVYLARADILRTREMYADLTAVRRCSAGRDALLPGETGRTHSRSRSARAVASAVELWRTHPSWEARARSLTAPDVLFRPGALSMFLSGMAADVALIEMASLSQITDAWVHVVQQLLAAGLIIAIGGVAVWRAVVNAVVDGRRTPSGWRAGFWLGAGLAVGELTSNGSTNSRWLPPHPEALVILVAVTALLIAWTAQYAELRIRTYRGRSLRPTMIFGLVTPWLVLAFTLQWWRTAELVNGWEFSTPHLLGMLGPSSAHPPLLLTVFTVILGLLPGGDATFAGLWWSVSLLWLFPLLLWAVRTSAGTARWLLRSKPGSMPLAVDLPEFRRIIRIGLIGGLVCCLGLLAASWGVDTVRLLHSGQYDAAAEMVWTILTIGGAMAMTAAAAGMSGKDRYPLIRALIAAGITALIGIAAAYLQGAVDGCLGPANSLITTCGWRPTESLGLLEAWLGYVLGPAVLVSAAAAALAQAVSACVRHRKHGEAATMATIGPRRLLHRRITVALVTAAAIGLVGVNTVHHDSIKHAPVSDSEIALEFAATPPPSQQTERLQIYAWVIYGGKDLVGEFDSTATAFNKALRATAGPPNPHSQAIWDANVPPVCAKIFATATNAENYLPIPLASGQQLWVKFLTPLRNAATACHALAQTKSDTSFLAVDDDLQDASTALYSLINWMGPWMGPVGSTPGSATSNPTVATEDIPNRVGTTQTLTDSGATLRFTVMNYSARPAGENTELVPAADRIATITVKTCRDGAPPHTPVDLTWSHWILVLADGAAATPVTSWSPQDFNAPLYPNGAQNVLSAGHCRSGLIPFDIPASERTDPVEVGYSDSPMYWRVTPSS